MTSGKNHDRITWLCLPWIFVSTVVVTKDLLSGFVVASGFLFSGLMFGPDLDIYSVQYKRWGAIKFIWLPYQKCLRHRSALSHGFILGTVIRSLYLFSFLFLIGIVLKAIALIFIPNPWQWVEFSAQILKIYIREIIALFIGLELGAMSHYIADIIDSWLKKVANQKKSQTKKVIRKSTNKPRKVIRKSTQRKTSSSKRKK